MDLTKLIISFILIFFGLILFNANELNQSIFLFINNLTPISFLPFWNFLTLFGDGLTCGCILLIIYSKNKNYAVKTTFLILIISVFIQLLKEFFNFPRPLGIYSVNDIQHIGNILTSRSFPSGHAATIFTLLLSLNVFNNKRFIYYKYILASIIAISRIMVGAHWLSDILVGAGVAIVCIDIYNLFFSVKTKYIIQKITLSLLLLVSFYSLFFFKPKLIFDLIFFKTLGFISLSYFIYSNVLLKKK